MNQIRVKNGYEVHFGGAPAATVTDAGAPHHVAVLPARIPHIKPKLMVAEGDSVRVGSPLFFDKRHPDVRFLSPGGGTVASIQFGPRRVIDAIVIALADEETAEVLDGARLAPDAVHSREAVIGALVTGGVWPFIRVLPYRDIAPTDGPPPPAIVVSLSNREPFHPRPSVYLDGNRSDFDAGLAVLNQLTDRIVVTIDDHDMPAADWLDSRITHIHTGKYPAGDPGVSVYYLRKNEEENRSWYVSGQDLLLIGAAVRTGRYPTKRIIAVGGSAAASPAHLRTRIGMAVSELAPTARAGNNRYIAGGVFRGYDVPLDGYLGLFETALTVIPAGPAEEFLALVAPGVHRPSYSRVFLSALVSGPLEVDCNYHGEERACVACSYCNRVCPVEILPQLAFKSVLADEVEEALAHGLLDCVECGLCAHVCPSKIDISDILKNARRDYYKEQTR